MIYTPATEGVDHINAYSRSRTPLGRLLSNFAHTPFTLRDDGPFASVEAYWYWLSAPLPLRDTLRPLHGFEAKRQGRAIRGHDWPSSPAFRYKVCSALYAKVTQNPDLARLLAASPLPIVHYYVTAGGQTIYPENGEWMWSYYEAIRDAYWKAA